MNIDWIERGLRKPGKTQSGLARALGRNPSTVTALLKGQRRLQLHEIAMVAEYLEVTPPSDLGSNGSATTATVPVVGYVGAGGEAHFAGGQGPFDEISAPYGSTKATVAVRIKGDSLGYAFDGWYAVYDDRHNPPADSDIGKMCVCGLDDERVLIKTLRPGQLRDRWTLYSNTAPPIYDQIVLWAAPVKALVPP